MAKSDRPSASSDRAPDARPLPPRANLEHLKNEAKTRLKELRREHPQAKLAEAQYAIAKAYGFASWRAMKAHVDARQQANAAPDPVARALLEAVGRGSLEEVRRILAEQPAAVNAKGPHPFWGGQPQPLHVAVEHGDFDVFTYLLEHGAEVDGDNRAYDGWSPLMLAVHWEREAFVDAMLRRGAGVGLIEALMLEDDDRLQQLLRDDPDCLRGTTPNAATPLHFARTARAVELLMAAGIAMDAKDKYGKTALEAAASRGPEAVPVVAALRARGAAAHAGVYAAIGDLDGLQRAAKLDPQAIHRPYRIGAAAVTPLEAAVAQGHVAVVRWLLDQGLDVNQRLHEGGTALHVAAWNGHLEVVKLLIERNADASLRDGRYQGTPLDEARAALAKVGRESCARVAAYLESLSARAELVGEDPAVPALEPGQQAVNAAMAGDVDALRGVLNAHPDAINASEGLWGGTLLHQASWNGELAVIDLLLERGFPVNRRGGDDAMALHFAAERGQLRAVRRLVEAGAALNDAANDHELTPLGWAVCLGEHRDVADYLINQGAPVDIFSAVAMGRTDLVRQIVEADPAQLERPMAECEARRRPLHLAVMKNRPGVVKLLLELGADASARDANGLTPLAMLRGDANPALREVLIKDAGGLGFFEALAAEQFDLAERMLREQPARLKPGGSDDQALYRAASQGLTPAVHWLIAHGADVNGRTPDDCHQTVLHAAAGDDKLDVIAALLEADADPTLRDDRWNATAAGWAGYGNQKQAEALLREAEAKHENAPEMDTSGSNAGRQAVEAAIAGDAGALRGVLNAHPDAINATGGTWDQPLLHLAAWNGHLEAVHLLLARGFDVNTRDKGDNAYALHFAAGAGHLAVVRRLVEAGGDIHGEGDDHEVGVLGWATCLGGYHEDVAAWLLERGARHHIFSAIAMNDAAVVQQLVEADATQLHRRMSPNEHHRQPLHHAVAKDRPAMVKLLLELGADVHATDETGATPLTYATEQADASILAMLQNAGARIDLRGALRLKRYDLAEALVRENPSRIGPDGADTIALHLCAFHRDIEGGRWLIDHGVDVNAKRVLWRCNHTALHVCAEHDRREIAEMLLDAGADPEIHDDKYDSTVLGWAEHLGRPAIASLIKSRRSG